MTKYYLTMCVYVNLYLICTHSQASLSVLLTKYYWGDQIEKIEVGGACSTYGGQEWCIWGFRVET
jgi:hypothetical protein